MFLPSLGWPAAFGDCKTENGGVPHNSIILVKESFYLLSSKVACRFNIKLDLGARLTMVATVRLSDSGFSGNPAGIKGVSNLVGVLPCKGVV